MFRFGNEAERFELEFLHVKRTPGSVVDGVPFQTWSWAEEAKTLAENPEHERQEQTATCLNWTHFIVRDALHSCRTLSDLSDGMLHDSRPAWYLFQLVTGKATKQREGWKKWEE